MRLNALPITQPACVLLTLVLVAGCRSTDLSTPMAPVVPTDIAAPAMRPTENPSLEARSEGETVRPIRRVGDHMFGQISGKQIALEGYIRVMDREPSIQIRLLGLLDIGPSSATTTYHLTDNFGRMLETLIVHRTADGTSYKHSKGDDAVPSEAVDLDEILHQTDLTWRDLTMDYLWWDTKSVRTNATDRGVPCDVLTLAPSSVSTLSTSAQVWLTTKRGAITRVTIHGPSGDCLREVMVKSYYRKTGLFGKLTFKQPDEKGYTLVRITKYSEVDHDSTILNQ
jgi:hypothetical protein